MPAVTDSLRPISIWRPTTAAGGEVLFVRPEPGPWGDHYCDRRVIPRKSRARLRVCFFGESAAAGYLLAPHLTPAKALARLLGDDVEVVDLARTNERLDSMIDTIGAARQLSPDILVVFAGNNWNLLETPRWSPLYPSAESRRRLASVLRHGGLLEPVEEANRELVAAVERLFRSLVEQGTRTIMVTPEVNLRDWRSRQPVPWLRANTTWDWHRLERAGRWHLARGSWSKARQAARAMLEIDGGCCPTGFDLLAQASLALGNREETIVAARAAVGTANYPLLATLEAPRARPVDQTLIIEGAERHGLELVSLPEVFAVRDEVLAGRELFYDYCHLTPEGIDLAMTAVARQILGARPAAVRSSPGSKVLSRAAIGAAVHGVHRGAEGEIVRYWLDRACALDRAARDTLTRLVRARDTPVPAVLTPEQLVDRHLTLQHGWQWEGLDAETLAAVGDVLGSRVLAESLTRRRVELWSRLDRVFPEAMGAVDVPTSPVFRALWPETAHALVLPEGGEVELVVRSAGGRPKGGRLRVALDGRRLAALEVGPEWQRSTIDIPAGQPLRRLVLGWGPAAGDGDSVLGAAVDRLDRGLETLLHPVFGEIFSVRVA